MAHLPSRIASLLLLSVAVASNASAAPPCSNKDFNGVYTTVAQGNLFFLPPVFTPLLGPVIKVARTIADGNGNVSEVADASYNGFAFREAPYSGKYSVQPDCTIVFNWLNLLPIVVNGAIVQFSPPIPLQFVGALAQDGSDVSVEIASVASGPPGSVIRVHMQRQISDRGADNDQNVACSDQTLRGGYQLDMHGEVTDTSRYPWPPLPTFSFSREGTLSFDGNGAFTGNTTANYGGLSVVQEPLQGTYSVDNSCNVTMLYTSGASYAWQGVTTGGGDGANLMVISPGGAVIAGTLLRQRGSQ